jgi:2-haloacid dehalogenase
MTNTLAFDVYGTLIDTNGVVVALQEMIGSEAAEFSRVWREKQLEYTFRRGLMQRYRNFSVCTRDALNFTCAALNIDLSMNDRQKLIDSYAVLPAFPDVVNALNDLKTTDYRLYAFSNGKADAVKALLDHAGILDHFIDVISVDEIQTFKPDPAVYFHLLKRCNSVADSSWLISGNAFDVIGAKSAGLRGIWLKRTAAAVFDPWEDFTPDASIPALAELDEAIRKLG